MNDIRVLFDSRDPESKSPAGPVESGTFVRFCLKIEKRIVVRTANLIIRYDRHEIPAYYPMEQRWMPGEYHGFETGFTIEDRGLYWYHFEVETDLGKFAVGCSGSDNRAVVTDEPKSWQQTVYREDYGEPSWIYGGVYYHIFVDRFRHAGERVELPGKITREDWGGLPEYRPADGKVLNNDFFGGNLAGIREKLPYLADLGVTCLYLSPIFEAYSNHKYDTADYTKIDPMFGTDEEFSALCREASALGLRIILDGVFAHTGADSVYFNKYEHYGAGGAWNDPGSPYRNWYTIHEDGSYDAWWGIETLPKINKEDPGFRAFMTGEDGIVRRWLRKGASGWRLDVVDELPSGFLEEVVAAARAEKSDALMIGEVWEDASNKEAYSERKNYFEGNKLDSVMNYPFRNTIIDYVRSGEADVISGMVEEILEHYPPFAVHALMNLLGTHDIVRAITALAGKNLVVDFSTREEQAHTALSAEERETGVHRMKMASLLQMTLPGVPCIYYGDEAGVEGYADPFNRKCYPWDRENEELLTWYRKLIALRKSHEVYRQGNYRTLASRNGLYAFERYSPEGRCPSVITAVNAGAFDECLTLETGRIDLLTGDAHEGMICLHPGEFVLLSDATR